LKELAMSVSATLNRTETTRLASRPLQASHLDATDREMRVVVDVTPDIASTLASQLLDEARGQGLEGLAGVTWAEQELARRTEAALDALASAVEQPAAALVDHVQAQQALGRAAARASA
jgi:hypothetical protein